MKLVKLSCLFALKLDFNLSENKESEGIKKLRKRAQRKNS